MFDSNPETVYKTVSKAERVKNATLGETELVAALGSDTQNIAAKRSHSHALFLPPSLSRFFPFLSLPFSSGLH